jgi:hypothetical protein
MRLSAEDAMRVMRQQVTPLVRRCYADEWRSNPDVAGSILVGVHIEPDGSAFSAKKLQSEGLPDSLVECILASVRGARFPPAGPKGTEMTIPFKFVPRFLADGGAEEDAGKR